MDEPTNLHSQLAAYGAQFDGDGLVLNFGDRAAELHALQTAAVLVPLTHAGVIKVSGDDAQSFLNTQLTSDVVQVTPGTAQYSGYCTPKGRLLATFLVCQYGSDYLLLLPHEIAESIAESLQRYVLRAKVKIELASDAFGLLGVAGPESASSVTESLGEPSVKLMAVVSYGAASLITLPASGYLVICSRDDVGEQWNALSEHATAAGVAAWQLQGIRAGIATITAATQEMFIPQMLGLEHIGAVSFEKGCYPGQEIVARTQYLGNLKRQLYSGRSNQSLVPGDTILDSSNDKTIGTVTNAAPTPDGDWEFLAVLQRDAVERGAGFTSPHGQSLQIARPMADILPKGLR